MGDYPAARALCEDTLARRRRILGDDHPDTLASARSLAGVLRVVGEEEKARDLYREVWQRRRRVLGPTHPRTLDTGRKLDLLLEQLGQPPEAQVDVRRPAGPW